MATRKDGYERIAKMIKGSAAQQQSSLLIGTMKSSSVISCSGMTLDPDDYNKLSSVGTLAAKDTVLLFKLEDTNADSETGFVVLGKVV